MKIIAESLGESVIVQSGEYGGIEIIQKELCGYDSEGRLTGYKPPQQVYIHRASLVALVNFIQEEMRKRDEELLRETDEDS